MKLWWGNEWDSYSLEFWGFFGICRRKAVKLCWDSDGIRVPGNLGDFGILQEQT